MGGGAGGQVNSPPLTPQKRILPVGKKVMIDGLGKRMPKDVI